MSYILDALKRAERERKQGQISVLDELPPAQAAAEPRAVPLRWVVLGAAAAVVLVAGPLLLLHFHRAAPAAVQAAAPVVAAPAPAAPPPPQTQVQAVTPPPTAPAPQAKIEDSGSIATLDDVSPPAQPGNQGQQQDQDQAQDQNAAPDQPPPRQRPSAGHAGARPGAQVVEGEPPPPPVIDAPPQAQAADAAAPQPALQPGLIPTNAPPPSSQQLQEMPDSYRANFPALSLDVLAYNSNAQRRFVLIGGKRYHEGDTIAEGPRIVSILADGVVFDWQGQQVLYPSSH